MNKFVAKDKNSSNTSKSNFRTSRKFKKLAYWGVLNHDFLKVELFVAKKI